MFPSSVTAPQLCKVLASGVFPLHGGMHSTLICSGNLQKASYWFVKKNLQGVGAGLAHAQLRAQVTFPGHGHSVSQHCSIIRWLPSKTAFLSAAIKSATPGSRLPKNRNSLSPRMQLCPADMPFASPIRYHCYGLAKLAHEPIWIWEKLGHPSRISE